MTVERGRTPTGTEVSTTTTTILRTGFFEEAVWHSVEDCVLDGCAQLWRPDCLRTSCELGRELARELGLELELELWLLSHKRDEQKRSPTTVPARIGKRKVRYKSKKFKVWVDVAKRRCLRQHSHQNFQKSSATRLSVIVSTSLSQWSSASRSMMVRWRRTSS
mmetsp:Transcript_11116/g.29858  ORF Transcript_11116/g.29858 Transcript_11116/m.29858 type:complete len:163 (-) Transcript_11116:1134-1622(-)